MLNRNWVDSGMYEQPSRTVSEAIHADSEASNARAQSAKYLCQTLPLGPAGPTLGYNLPRVSFPGYHVMN